MPINKNCTTQQDLSECLSYEQMPENLKINLLGHLITAITIVTEQQDSNEYTLLQENSAELENLKEFMQVMLKNDSLALEISSCKENDLLHFIKKNQEHLKSLCASLYMPILQTLVQGKNQEFPEDPASFSEHPIAFYAELLNDFAETKFFSLDEQTGTAITHAFNYCCQKLYNECVKLEEQITKKQLNNLVDSMWTFALLEKNKNEIIYVLGGWRLATIMVILEEQRQQSAEQSLENLDDKNMLKLMEALTVGSSLLNDDENDDEDQDEEDDEDEDDDCCCHEGCCGK